MKKFKYILVILLLVSVNQSLFAAIERFSNRKDGDNSVSPLTASSTMELYDDKYYDMSTDPFWSTRFANKKSTGMVRLGINPDVNITSAFNGAQSIEITYWKWNATTGAFETTVETTTFHLYYSTTGTAASEDQSTFVFEGAHRISVRLLSGTLPLDKLFLETSLEVERYYVLNNNSVINLKHTEIDVAGATADGPQIEFNWDTKEGAEFYELEWVHINDYTLTPGTYLNAANLNYNFYLNSTRIETKQNWYRIPRIFDHGYILYRVRPIGKTGTNFTERQDGIWSAGESGVVSSFTSANKIVIGQEFSPLNWSHSVVYTENGKRLDGVSYADGLGRSHQSVGYNSVTNQAIVSNIYYDELGRAAVSDLPTPVAGAAMKYQHNFNLVDGTSIPYSWHYFDLEAQDQCILNSTGFSTNSGAGKYYSPSNPDQNGANVAIPDAEKYPFSRVTYLNDYSNRVERIAAAGDDLKTGSGKETKIFYPSTNQEELNQLFGSEVGWFKHYTKMITVDPNGQIYVQYMDMAGRTVASYMEGPSPDNVDGIEGNVSENLVVTMIDSDNPEPVNTSVPYSELSYSQYISSDTVFNFDYSFTPAQFQSACTGTLCLDCIYDLEIEVRDYCGESVALDGYTNPVQLIGSDIDEIINGTCHESTVHSEIFSAHLSPGMYTIYKKLSINEQASDEYWCLYLEANTCIETVQSVFNGLYAQEPFSACDPELLEDEESGSECSVYEDLMLADVSPGGQYGLYNATSWTATDAYSVYNPSGALGVNWRSLTYLDAANNPVPASTLAGTDGLQWFVTHFREEWAAVLLHAHPEFCYLNFCESNTASHTYDNEMLAVQSYVGADIAGFLMPLAGGTPNVGFNSPAYFPPSFTNSYQDPFFTSGGLGASRASAMLTRMNNYETVFGMTFSMWEYAVYLATGQSCRKTSDFPTCMSLDDCSRDLVWLTFRELYLEEKANQAFLAQQEYATANGCSNECIGIDASVTVAACTQSPQNQLAGRKSRFGNINQFNSTTTNPSTPDDMTLEMEAAIQDLCNSSCDNYVAEWLQSLAGCSQIAGMTPAALAALKADLKAVCMAGCNQDHPMGATTTPPGVTVTAHGFTSAQEVLDYHLGTIGAVSGYPNEGCSFYLITQPGPYKPAQDLLNDLPVMDQCGCDILITMREDYLEAIANNQISATMSMEQYLAVSKGISLDDVDNLLCVCDQFYDGTNNEWSEGANAQILAAKKVVPKTLTCAVTASCKTCAEMDALYTAVYTYANNTLGLDAADFEQASNYESILTGFFNSELGYNLTFRDYDFFRKGCLATSSSPVCEQNPVMGELKDLLSLLAMRNQLVPPASLNLVNENIVYKQGKLRRDALLGASYSSSVSSGTLTMSFQDGSQTPCTISMYLNADPNFDFSKVVSFGELWPTTTSCTNNTKFQIELKYYSCGQLTTAIAEVSTSCLQVNLCYCGDNGQRLCDEPFFDPDYEVCYQPKLNELMQSAVEIYEGSVADAYVAFKQEYREKCTAAFSTEHFKMQGKYRFYQHTLFYYDQAGNLVRTVAPKGVAKMLPTQNVSINESRTNVGTPVVPTQNFETKYQYNSFNQLVSTTNPDQEGASKFWYDFYGRIALSQNPQQAVDNKYSYVFYDKLGRPVEAGQVVSATALNEATILKVQDPLSTVFQAWVKASGSVRTEVTRTYYDKVAVSAVQLRFANGTGQQNLRLRVASVAYYTTVTAGTDLATTVTGYASATHYTYDIHGNVLQTLQDVPELLPVNQNIKSTEYEFELISGNVKQVKYQKDQLDEITHTYIYDQVNRLEEVFVSTDKIHQSRQAHYLYYDYGPLARVELGEQKVQGMDYAYTINGWLKSMNGTVLNPGYELGRDNASGYLSQNTSVHSKVARDVVGYTLGYFNGDYQSIGSTNFAPSPYEVSPLNNAISQLYNGNIAYTTTAIADVPSSGTAMGIQMGVYRYDQMNRLVGARTFRSSGLSASNSWAGAAETQEYKSTYSYDLNGNLTHLLRNGGASNLNMDDFTYNFESIGGKPSNRLDYVDDITGYTGNYTDDIDDQSADNYGYDKLGQLTRDNSEGSMTIEWYSGNRKVKKITRTGQTIEFTYNPFGQRILKKVTNTAEGGSVKMSYYAYDANGAVMGVYAIDLIDNNADLLEQHIYGASRLGMIKNAIPLCTDGTAGTPPVYPDPTGPVNHLLGNKRYEITNYLGNVHAVISDRKLYVGGTYEAVVVMTSDYYPFGMEMPGRHVNDQDYRFGYNGMEKDNDVRGNGNSYTTEFRQYDPRLGRWLSLDPLMMEFPNVSPYVAFDDNPIYFTDPLGLAAEGGGDKLTKKEQEYLDKKNSNGGEHLEEVKITPAPGQKGTNVRSADEVQQYQSQPADKIAKTKPTFSSLEEAKNYDPNALPWYWYKETTFSDGREFRIRQAEYNGKLYAPVLNTVIPGWELASKLAEGEEIGVSDILIEGISLIPGGKLLKKGKQLFYKSGKYGDELIDVTKKKITFCFVAGTKISTEEGLKEIENIQVGDLVWAFDEQTRTNVLKPVLDTMIHQSDHLLKLTFNGKTLFTTNDHPFFVNGNWIEAKYIHVGDSLYLFNNTRTVIQDKEKIDTLVTVYNLEVSDAHTYYVGEDQILVHNKAKPTKVIKKGWEKFWDVELEKIKRGEGLARMGEDGQKIFRGDELSPKKKSFWAGALEWEVPGLEGHRILQKIMPDGSSVYARVRAHVYSDVYPF